VRWLLAIWPVVAAVAIITWFPHLPLAWYLIIGIVIVALPSVVLTVRSRWTRSRRTHARRGRATDQTWHQRGGGRDEGDETAPW
jgi:ABC-type Fe3+ transport system permease subunit